MILPFTASDKKMGSISSEVDKNTATSVPIVMIPPEYRFEAATENPHCGKIPATPPAIGPILPAFPNPRPRLCAGLMLQILHEQIGQQ